MSDFAKLAAAMEKAGGANDETQGIVCRLDSGFVPLNHALSGDWRGGFPGGRVIEIFGPESSGKTWLATQAMIAAQKAGGVVGFHDHERSFISEVGVKLGLDVTPGRWFFKQPDTFEESVAIFIRTTSAIRNAKVLNPKTPLVWVFDSLAQMVPREKLAKMLSDKAPVSGALEAKPGAGDLNMRDKVMLAQAASDMLPSVSLVAERNNVMVIFLNQLRMKPGVSYGDPAYSPGGNALKFNATTRIQISATRLMKDVDGEKVMVGQEVKAVCIKNKGARPFGMAKWKFMFGDDGVGRFALGESLIDFAVSKKLLTMSGAHVVWTDGGKYFKSVLGRKLEAEGKLGELEDLIIKSGVKPDEEKVVEEAEAEAAA